MARRVGQQARRSRNAAWIGLARAALIALVTAGTGQSAAQTSDRPVLKIADLPFPPDYRPFVRPPPRQDPTSPYTQDAARVFCGLALRGPPMRSIPFNHTDGGWLRKCIRRFTNPAVPSGKPAETLVCEQRRVDAIADAFERGIGLDRLRPTKSFMAQCEREYRTSLIPPPRVPVRPPRSYRPRPAPPPPEPRRELAPAKPTPPPYNPREREATAPVKPPPPVPDKPVVSAAPSAPAPASPSGNTNGEGGGIPVAPVVALLIVVGSFGGLVMVLYHWESAAVGKLLRTGPNIRRLREKEALHYVAAAEREFKAAEEEPGSAGQHLKAASELLEKARKAQTAVKLIDEQIAVEEAEARGHLADALHKQALARERRDIERVEVSAGKSKAAATAFEAAYEAKVAKKAHADDLGIELPESARSTTAALLALLDRMRAERTADGDLTSAHSIAAVRKLLIHKEAS